MPLSLTWSARLGRDTRTAAFAMIASSMNGRASHGGRGSTNGCDAAIILVSPLVFSEGKPWVGRETFTLLVRHANDPSLPIIPVVFGQDTAQRLKVHERFKDLNVGEITQHVYAGDIEATLGLIARSLRRPN